MSVAKLLPAGGANDFNVAITGTYTVVTFTKEYASGGYSIVSSVADSTIDIYAFNADGTTAGYTGTKSFTASKGFNKMVILGGTNGDLLSFTYKQTFISNGTATETTAGPWITSASTSYLPNTSSTTVLTGGNFASGMTAVFTSATTSTTVTAGVSVSSATSATITRNGSGLMPPAYAPYTLTISNPGVSDPSGTSANKLAGFTVGALPIVNSSLFSYTTGTATSISLVATDADTSNTSFTWAVSSGTLPTGLTLTSTSGVVSGTPTTSQQTVTFAVTDGGGNTTTGNVLFNAVPVWSTAAGALSGGVPTVAYSVQLTATGYWGSTNLFYYLWFFTDRLYIKLFWFNFWNIKCFWNILVYS
jgi:hypothetical protein